MFSFAPDAYHSADLCRCCRAAEACPAGRGPNHSFRKKCVKRVKRFLEIFDRFVVRGEEVPLQFTFDRVDGQAEKERGAA